MREIRAQRTIDVVRSCKLVGRKWSRLEIRRYGITSSGSQLGLALVARGERRRRPFIVDNVALSRKKPNAQPPEPAPPTDPPPTTEPSPEPTSGGSIDASKYVRRVYLGNSAFSSGEKFNCANAVVDKAQGPEGLGSMQGNGQWDLFRLPDCGSVAGSERGTWVDMSFARMGETYTYEWWQVFDALPEVYYGHAGTNSIRQTDASLSSGCDGGGNRDNIALSVPFYTSPLGAKRFGAKANGGPDSPCAGTQRTHGPIDMGPIEVGKVYHWRVQVRFTHLSDGFVRIWKNGVLQGDEDGDGFTFEGPVGYRLAPDGDNIASSSIRIQHGFYRHPNNTSTWAMRTSGFGFLR